MADEKDPKHHEEEPQPDEAANDEAPEGETGEHEDAAPDEPSPLQQERDELFQRLQRVSADYQNFMRRSEQSRTEAVNLALADALRSLIPVLDHFDRALETPADSNDAQALHQGMRIVRDEFLKALQGVGVERLEVETGEVFDPHRHEAMLRQPAEGIEPNHVTALLQPGYVFRGRVLRAAKVAVAPAED